MYQVLRLEQTEIYTTGDSTTHVRAYLVCDTLSDLPGINDISGYTLEMGSGALVIQDAVQYKMKSDGTWVLQQTADLQTIITTLSQIQSDISDIDNDIIDINADILTLQQKQQLLSAAVSLLINDGAKNRLKLTPTSNTQTSNGVTMDFDPQTGLVTLTGQHISTDATAIFNMYTGNAADQYEIPAGDYHISGTPAGGSTSTYRAILRGLTEYPDTGSGADFTLNSPHYVAYSILVTGNVDFGAGMTWEPMVCYQKYYEQTPDYRIYAPTNRELYEMI